MIELDIQALPKQLEFLQATEREVLYSGAFGAGKSRAVCLLALLRASKPGTREGLCRKSLVALKGSTLRTLLEPEGDLPAVLPAGCYTHHKADKIIKLHGGGEIVYFGLDEPQKIGSYNLSGCGIDEAVELNEEDYTMLRGRVRLKIPGVHGQLYGATNPGPPGHFLAQRFGLSGGARAAPNCKAIATRSTDNFYLPAEYVDDLATYTGVRRKRFVEGLWVGSEGLVYDCWDRSRHVRNVQHKVPGVRYVVGMDYGYRNPFAALLLQVSGDGAIDVSAIAYARNKTKDQQIQAVKDFGVEPETVVYDPSAAELGDALRAAGLHATAADNAVIDGIDAVQAMLQGTREDGSPRLTVDPSCTDLIAEFESYEWMDKADKDKPVKEMDHALDALRYAVMYLKGGSYSTGSSPTAVQDRVNAVLSTPMADIMAERRRKFERAL